MQCPKCGSYNVRKKGTRNNKQRYKCKNCVSWFSIDLKNIDTDQEIVIDNVRLAKKVQRFMDSNRIERKSFREFARIENALVEYNKELIKLLKDVDLSVFKYHPNLCENECVGILHITDPHFNELVNMEDNKFDFEIASKRCEKLVSKTRNYFSLYGIRNILFAMTGDILNSDRRLDELLSQATNRSKASLLCSHILKQMLIDLNRDFNINVACVTGNESRVQHDIGWSDVVATDNYDFTVFNILRYLFFNCEGIHFILNSNPLEQVINVAGKNILILHGHQLANAKIETTTQKIKGKYAAKGILIDFILMGHMHSCRIGDMYARGSSMVGANAFSDSGLQLTSRASQNIHVVGKNFIDSIKVDLQDTEGIEGYDIIKELEAYHCKSSDKLHEETTIFKVVV